MTRQDKERCYKIVNEMVSYGYYTFDETPEMLVDRLGLGVNFWEGALEQFKKARGIRK